VQACACLAIDHGTVIHRTDSPFGHIFITEDDRGVRSLYFDEGTSRQGAVIPGRSTHLVLPYTRVATVGLAVAPRLERVLFVGLGVGAMPMYARALFPNAQIDVVEIDSVVLDLAQSFFGFAPDGRMSVHVADGRAFVEGGEGISYDLIVLDAYSDEGIPRHLTTREFLTSVRSLLTLGGVVVSNLWRSSDLYDSMVATFADVFGEVSLLRVEGGAGQILVASADQRPMERAILIDAARRLTERADLGFDLAQLIERGYEKPTHREAPVLRDDK
jgi:spermidine synthase